MTANNTLQSDLRKLQLRNTILAVALVLGTLANALVFRSEMAFSLLLLAVALLLQPIAGLVQHTSHRLTMVLLAASKVLLALMLVMLVASVIGAS